LHIVIREDDLARHIPEDGDIHSHLAHVSYRFIIY